MWMVVSFQFLLKFTNLLLKLLHLIFNCLDALVVVWMMVALFGIGHGLLLIVLPHRDANRESRIFQ